MSKPRSSQEELSPSDPLLSRARELLLKELPKKPCLFVKPPGDTPLWCPESRFYHPWLPEHRRLTAAGWRAFEQDSPGEWDQIVLFGGRHKEENRQLVTSLRSFLSEQGTLYFVLPNDYGAKSFLKEFKAEGDLKSDFVGRKSRLFLLPQKKLEHSSLYQLQPNEEGLLSTPGLFSWSQRDRGSQILADVLAQEKLDSPVADLGAGWGFLSSQLPTSTNLHLLEADIRGVEACGENLKDFPSATVHWADVTQLESLPQPLVGRMRTVITNPPFHTNKKAEPVLGGAFVAAARHLLGKRGQFFLVGNTHLPYHRVMTAFFPIVEAVSKRDGFTVYRGSIS